MIVRPWMSTQFVLLPIETSLPDALRFLKAKGMHLVGVLRHGHVAGAVTRSGITEALESGDSLRRLSRKTLGSIVPPSATTVQADDPIDRAARALTDPALPAIPVVERTDLVGVITPTEICRAMCRVLGSPGPEAPVTLSLTAPRDGDLVEEIRRRSQGYAVEHLIAYPSSTQEWQVTMRMKARPEASAPAAPEFEQCA